VLTTLDLSGDRLNSSGIRPEGAVEIAKALKVNAVLKSLDISRNEIKDEGATAIAEALKVNAVLTKLELHNNDLNEEAKDALRAAAKPLLELEL